MFKASRCDGSNELSVVDSFHVPSTIPLCSIARQLDGYLLCRQINHAFLGAGALLIEFAIRVFS